VLRISLELFFHPAASQQRTFSAHLLLCEEISAMSFAPFQLKFIFFSRDIARSEFQMYGGIPWIYFASTSVSCFAKAIFAGYM
jgi:hypothetical protein